MNHNRVTLMMFRKFYPFLMGTVMAAGCLSVQVAHAASAIDVGIHNLLPNTPNQVVSLFVSGDELVRGFNLRAQIGDGTGPGIEPVFSGVDFTGGIWDAHPITTLGGPVDGALQYAQASVDFSESGVTVTANGLVAKALVSTVGIMQGTFDLTLTSADIGEDTDFIRVGGGTFVPSITNGSLVIVPEPQALAWLALAGIVITRVACRIRL